LIKWTRNLFRYKSSSFCMAKDSL